MTVSLRLAMISSSPPMLSNVTSIEAGGMISPAIVDSYSSSSSASSCDSDNPVWDSSVAPFARLFLDEAGLESIEEMT